jgi:nucleotide-binding universal stress UspA family protein
LGARLVAVHAWSDVTGDAAGHLRRSSESVESLATEASRFLDAWLETVRERHPRLEIERRVVDGTPLRSLIEAVPGARVLVVGTRGRAGGDGMLIGSTSNALLEFAPCPIVVVHGRRPATAATAAGERRIEARP